LTGGYSFTTVSKITRWELRDLVCEREREEDRKW
jgi:hypothetical protein